jgi:hypothetical protein
VTSKDATFEQARAAKRKALELCAQCSLDAAVGITRLGAGYGLKLNFERPPVAQMLLPESIDGVPAQIEVVGPVRKR